MFSRNLVIKVYIWYIRLGLMNIWVFWLTFSVRFTSDLTKLRFHKSLRKFWNQAKSAQNTKILPSDLFPGVSEAIHWYILVLAVVSAKGCFQVL